jgi:hypothetical protein
VGAILARISAAKNAFVEPGELERAEIDAKHASDYGEIASLV